MSPSKHNPIPQAIEVPRTRFQQGQPANSSTTDSATTQATTGDNRCRTSGQASTFDDILGRHEPAIAPQNVPEPVEKPGLVRRTTISLSDKVAKAAEKFKDKATGSKQ
jgi:hypothetical protein